MFNIGVTATREDLTGSQLRSVIHKLRHLAMTNDLYGVTLHQGCCVGGDEQITIAAAALGMSIIAHPPTDRKLMSMLAFELATERKPENPYLMRNRSIVDASDIILAAPKEMREELRSGTWSTIRYARSLNKMMIVVWRDGGSSDYA